MSDTMENRAPAKIQYPPTGYAWYVVVLLTLGYILSYIDRSILSMLVEPIKADFDLTDTQIGLLLGPAFAIFYASMGLPLGWLADNMKRRTLVGIGIFVWSAATCFSGFAKGFASLFIARVTVGAGEATLGPCAISLISDMFPEGKRARALAVYSTALSIASAIAFFGGAKLLAWANNFDTTGLPIIEGLKPWQIVFIIVGSPGLILGLLMLSIKEPKRQADFESDGVKKQSVKISDTLKYYKENGGPFFSICMLLGLMLIIVYSQFFATAMYERTWGWTASEYGVRNAVGLIIFGPTSVMFGGWLVDYFHDKGVKDAGLKVLKIGFYILVPFNIIYPLMPNPWAALIVSFIGVSGIAITTVAGLPTVLKIIPAQIRGQSIAIYYMIMSLAGLFIGPTAVGFTSDVIFGDPSKLNYAMALVTAVFGIIALLALPFVTKIYSIQIKKEITI